MGVAREAWRDVQCSKAFIVFCSVAFFLSAIFPSDLVAYRDYPQEQNAGGVTRFVEDYGRYTNNLVQLGLPLVKRDVVGLVQLAYVAVSTTVATQGLKFALNNVVVGRTRLGERPQGPNSRANMPSGHSSMASCGAYFVCRRYGWKYALLTVPILFLTMYARYMLDAHTISAVIAGALLGILMTALFTSPYRGRKRAEAQAAGFR